MESNCVNESNVNEISKISSLVKHVFVCEFAFKLHPVVEATISQNLIIR